MNYNTILFDLDGTLSDSAPGILNCVEYALASFGIRAERSELYCFVGPPLTESFMTKFGFDAEQAAQAQSKYRERFSPVGILENEMYPGIGELLKTLHENGFRLAVATSKPTPFSRQIVERYGLMPYLELVLGSEFDGRRHSKAEVIRDVLAQLGVAEEDKSRVVMVGDRSYDVLGARKNGIDCIGAGFGYAEPGELERAGAVCVAATVEELGRILLSGREQIEP